MSDIYAPVVVADVEKVKSVELTFNLAQAAGTYDIGTVSGGDILIIEVVPYVAAAAVGLTTAAIQTNNTVPIVILAAAVAAALTIDLNLASFLTRILLVNGKKIQGTIVGTGSAGSIKLAVRYQPLAVGAVLA